MLDVSFLDIERHHAGPFDHGGRQALIRMFVDRHDAFRANHHRLGAPLQHHAGSFARGYRDAGIDRHAGGDVGSCVVGTRPGTARYLADLPFRGRRCRRSQVGQDGQEGRRGEEAQAKMFHEGTVGNTS